MIEPAAADKLGLPAFGELHVAGIAGRVPCQYRRASSLTVGPLTMARPLFMEMALGGLVRGAPGPVIGIIGCCSWLSRIRLVRRFLHLINAECV